MIHVIVRERDAAAQATEPITSGSVGLGVSFRFSEDWDGMGKAAIFKGSGTAVDMALTGNSCVVPHEVLANAGGHLKIGVYGTKDEGQKVTPTIWADAGPILEGAEPSEVDPTPATESLVQQILEAAEAAQDAAEDAEEIAQSVRDDADAGEFDGEDGYSPSASVSKSGKVVTITITDKEGTTTETVSDGEDGEDGDSAYEIAVKNGYSGTEEQWLESLHGQDATVDATLSHAGEAADAAETGKVKHTADYAELYVETLNSGESIPLDTEWERGGTNSYGVNDSRAYRVRSAGYLKTKAKTKLQIASGYQFFVVIRKLDNTYVSTTDWTTSHTVPADRLYRVVIRAYPEDTSITADVDTFSSQISIENGIGSGGGGGTSDYTDLANKPKINSVTLSGNKSLSDLGIAAASAVPAAATNTPADLGTAAVGSSAMYAKEDHVHKRPTAADIGAIAAPASPSAGDVLTYSNGAWEAVAPSGGSSDFVLLVADEDDGKAYDNGTEITGSEINALAAGGKAVFLWDEDNDRLYAYVTDTSGSAVFSSTMTGSIEYITIASDSSTCVYSEFALTKGIFWATYNTTTNAEIEAAYQAGKEVIVAYNSKIYRLVYRGSATSHTFSYFNDSSATTGQQVSCSGDTWSAATSHELIRAPSSPSVGDFLVYTANGWAAQSLSTWQGGSY